MAMTDLTSYLSASEFPWKVVRIAGEILRDIPPLHLQLYPTNRCNADCNYCSCEKVDRDVELPLRDIEDILRHFRKLGTRAVTLSGGGEPTIHKNFDSILLVAQSLGLKIGLATNGLRLLHSSNAFHENRLLTWCRVSITPKLSPERAVALVRHVCSLLPDVDVGVSMVIDAEANLGVAEALCKEADSLPITHIRFVQEILGHDDSSMSALKQRCDRLTNKAYFQWRSTYCEGSNPCYLARLKPLVSATGEVYPCCGVQYAAGDDKHLPREFSMGMWSQYQLGAVFDGSICKRCYYWNYNTVLSKIVGPMTHEEFL